MYQNVYQKAPPGYLILLFESLGKDSALLSFIVSFLQAFTWIYQTHNFFVVQASNIFDLFCLLALSLIVGNFHKK